MRLIVKLLLIVSAFCLSVGCSENSTDPITPPEPEPSTSSSASMIDLSTDHQVIRGFGAANILPWRPDMNSSDIELAFGTGHGKLGFSILRLMIQENPDDWSMNIPTAKEAYDRGVLVMASPWNAPDELLKPGSGPDTVAQDMYDEYAEHLNSYNSFMAENGVDLYAVSVQNEPDYAEDWTGWSPEGMLKFMRENASAIDTRVMAPESFQFRRSMSDPLLNDAEANAELDIVGGHIYGGGLEPYPQAKQAGKEVWMTEHLDTDITYNAVLATGKEIHDCLAVANFNAYIWWYIKRFYGPINEDGQVSKRGYIMSHYSRFIRPGYQRKEASSDTDSDIYVSAYEGDDRVVIVAVNMSGNTTELELTINNSDHEMEAFTPYVTNSEMNVSEKDPISFSGESSGFSYELPYRSIVTFVEE